MYKENAYQCRRCGAMVPFGAAFCPCCGLSFKKSHKSTKKKILIVAIIFSLLIALYLSVSLFWFFKETSVNSVSFSESKIVLLVGRSQTVSYTVSSNNDKNKEEPTFTSSNERIATVDETGKIVAQSAGECTVTIKIGTKKDTLKVVVEKIDLIKLCDRYLDHVEGAIIAQDGSFLKIDTNFRDSYNYIEADALTAIADINAALGLPLSFTHEILETPASAYQRSQTFEDIGLVVSWKWNPVEGLEVTYRLDNY